MVSSNGNVQPTFRLNLHIGDVQWECSIGFSPQPTHWKLPVGMFNRLFTSTYTLEAFCGNVHSAFHLNLHIGSFQWECSVCFSTQLTHWRRPVGTINQVFTSTYTLETSSGNVQPTFRLNLHIGAVQ